MIRTAVKVTWGMAGLLCLLALADRWGWLMPLWSKLFPEVLLSRPLTACEIQIAELAKQIEATHNDISTLKEVAAASEEKRRTLEGQLVERAGYNFRFGPQNSPRFKTDPVAVALDAAISAAHRHEAETQAEIKRKESEIDRLKSRVIALQNGVSPLKLTGLTRPSEQLPREDGG
jgi:septal ring factor EnvC (AmiA/AmiB activator)